MVKTPKREFDSRLGHKMKIQITEGEYKTLKGALRRCDAGNDSFATDCFLLGLKLVKARNYSQCNKTFPRHFAMQNVGTNNEERKP